MTNESTFTRRRLLKGASGAAAAAAVLIPPNVRKMLAQPAPRRSAFGDIKRVVVLMQENRSFDHYFGTMAGVRGFRDPDALQLSNGRSVFYQPDEQNPKGYLLPFHLDTLTSRRLGVQPEVRPHFGPAVSRSVHRSARAEHHGLAAADVRRSDASLSL
jgi:phospholipase C